MSWNGDDVSWTIGGTKIIDGVAYNKLPDELINSLPSGFGGGLITADSTVNDIIQAVFTEIERLGNQRIGSAIGVGIDGRPVVQTINDVMFVATTDSYTAGISSNYGTTAYNVFPTGSVTAVTNYIVKRGSAVVNLYIISPGGSSTSYSRTMPSDESVNSTGTTGWLSVTSDTDPFVTTPALSGAVRAIKIQASPTTPLSGTVAYPAQYSYYLTLVDGLSIRRSIPFIFYVDKPRGSDPDIYSAIIDVDLTSSEDYVYVSGIPRIPAGSQYNISISLDCSVVSEFYNLTKSIAIASTFFGTVNSPLSEGEVTYAYTHPDGAMNITRVLTLANNAYAATHSGMSTVTLWRYDGAVTSSTTPITISIASVTDIAVDTVSLALGAESSLRVKSGTGQYPTIGNGAGQASGTYDSMVSLALNEELQLLNGLFCFPTRNHSIVTPAGPDYSDLDPATFNNVRWMTKKIVFSPSQVITRGQLTLNNANSDLVAAVDAANLYIYICPDDTIWYSGTDTYDPSDVTVNNGQGAVELGAYGDVMEGDDYVVPITFGDALTVSNMYVRVGIKSGSNLTFQSVSFSIVAS